MILCVSKKIVVFVLVLICLILFFSFGLKQTEEVISPSLKKTIVIDAGHGGIDGGCVGASGVTESELNLAFSLQAKKTFEKMGFKVVLTRENMDGLYDPFAKNKKRSEMEKREHIIKQANPDVLISFHMNALNLKSVDGAQVFYQQGRENGQEFAKVMTETLMENDIKLLAKEKKGDFYVLNCTKIPAILIECGFLSNLEEEALLTSEEYQERFCESVLQGVLLYL